MTPPTTDLEVPAEERTRSALLHPAVLALAVVALFAAGFAGFRLFSGGDTVDAGSGGGATVDLAAGTGADADGEADGGVTDGGSGASANGVTDSGGDNDSSAGDPAGGGAANAPFPTPDGAYVRGVLDLDATPGPGMFTLTGRVPNEQVAEAVGTAAEVAYAPFVKNRIEVDPTVAEAPWMEVAPRVVGLLPTITDGTMQVDDAGIHVAGRSPNDLFVQQLGVGLETYGGGLPVEIAQMEITGLTAPEFRTAVDRGVVTISGTVPSEAVKAYIAGGAAVTYGAENVVDEMTIDEATFRSFWMYTTPAIYNLLSAFPAYEFNVIDSRASGSIRGGVNFAVDSTEITPQAAQALNVGVAILARDPSLSMTVTGHTDDTGSDMYNQQLSLDRAESVVGYFVAGGVGQERLVARGAGESDPIAPNETEEGKALNRRVEFEFGFE
ncbi:MAG: OmpA family protein [Acidimicrobiales bacterium]